MFGRSRRDDTVKKAAFRLYEAVIRQSRAPAFHSRLGVPDTIDGRFDMLVLHTFLVLEALKRQGETAAPLATEFVTAVFAGFEDALREMGVSDFGMTRRIKNMANAFYGRMEAYGEAVDDPALLEHAVLRNVYRADDARAADAAVIARYAHAAFARLNAGTLAEGIADFGPTPE